MASQRGKVFVAVSGGVDSAVATLELLRAGYDCEAMFMITHDAGVEAQADAERVCVDLQVKLHVLDLRPDFEQIIDYFCAEYAQARTPNPCVLCNRQVKFGRLWDFATQEGAEYLATGQYARILNIEGHCRIYQACHIAKDQSYVLAMIQRDILPHILLPMGEKDKSQARQIAAAGGLHVHEKSDSQEICFIPDDNHVALLEKRHPELIREGVVLDSEGLQVGTHQGIHKYTIGQRRGLGIALHEPAYVVHLDAKENTVTLGSKEQTLCIGLETSGVNWLIDPPQSPFPALVKIRYNHRGAAATVRPLSDNKVEVRFDEPVSAVTPGQAAVFYIQDEIGLYLAGGGWIEKPLRLT